MPGTSHSSPAPFLARRTPGALALLAAGALLSARASAQDVKIHVEQVGAQPVTVHTAFGGFILGYDIDQAGKEGVLAEALTLPNGNHDVAVETFDQRTGKITHIVVQELDSKNDYLALGVVGKHTGLIEFEHVTSLFVDQRLYYQMNPLSAAEFTSQWTPPLTKNDIIEEVSRTQNVSQTVFLATHNVGGGSTLLLSSNVAANTFGPLVTLTHPNFAPNHSPKVALDSAHNQAVLAALGSNPFGPPTLGKVNLATGATTTFTGVGLGYVNGLAVDSATGVACTATEIDFRIEIYDLAAQTGFTVVLPKALSQAHSGQDVQLDPLHKLFLVGQPISSTAPSGSSVHVFDEQGQLVESIDGLQLPASPALLALCPRTRTCFVVKAPNLNELQSFSY